MIADNNRGLEMRMIVLLRGVTSTGKMEYQLSGETTFCHSNDEKIECH